MPALAVFIFMFVKTHSYLNFWGKYISYFLIDVWHFDADGVLSVRTTSKFHFVGVPVLY